MSNKNEPKASVAVIGAGIVGSMITRFLRADDFAVQLIDCREIYGASQCSAGVWKDSWVDKKLKDKCAITVEVANQILPGKIQELTFKEEGKSDQKLYKLDVEDILVEPDKDHKVMQITKDNELVFENGKKSQGFDFIVVAAGIWTDKLLVKSNIQPLAVLDHMFGSSLYFNPPKSMKPDNIIKTWAPYKQIVGFSRPGGYFFGDGYTVKNPPLNEPFDDQRVKKAHARLHSQAVDCGFKGVEVVGEFNGFRPYLKNKEDSMVNSYRGGTIIGAAGTAKNATILCGWIAAMVDDSINNTLKEMNM